jgi:hypothetical protein
MHLEKYREAISTIKKALCIKPSKTLMNYLNLLEHKLSICPHDLSSSIIEEKVETEGTKSENEKKIKKDNSIVSKFVFLKLARFLLFSCFNIVKKNKFLFFVLISISGYYFKIEIEKMFEHVLNIVKFK